MENCLVALGEIHLVLLKNLHVSEGTAVKFEENEFVEMELHADGILAVKEQTLHLEMEYVMSGPHMSCGEKMALLVVKHLASFLQVKQSFLHQYLLQQDQTCKQL